MTEEEKNLIESLGEIGFNQGVRKDNIHNIFTEICGRYYFFT